MGKYALEVENVSKSFRLPTEQASGIKQAFVNWTRGIKGYKEQKVLEDISFKVEKGDFFGIVGRNGSGKSTLLKIISQIYEPEKGEVKVNGTLVPFIELGVGFNPELTGRENVYLNGALLGFSHEEISELYSDIVEFAELEEFMDQKLKNYSSGMQVRLAFSIAIKADADVLVLDEVLAVGDEAFQRKCYQYFAELKRNKKTVILVTHDMDSVQRFCNKAIMIEKGKIIKSGNPSKVANEYSQLFIDQNKNKKISNNKISNNITAKVEHIKIKNDIKFNIEVISNIDIGDAVITFVINRDNGEMVYRWASDDDDKIINMVRGKKNNLEIILQNIFPEGEFDVQIGVKKRDRSENYAIFNNIDSFDVYNAGSKNIHWRPKQEIKYE